MSSLENMKLAFMGENLAMQYLSDRGHEIITQNYHSAYGELDLVTLDNNELVVVEVKTRTGGSLKIAADSITLSKQRKITLSALHFISEHPQYSNLSVRFDAAIILYNPEQDSYRIEYLKNAFYPDLYMSD